MKLHRMPLLITSLFVLASCGSAGASSKTAEHASSSAQEKQSSEKFSPESSKASSTEVVSSSVESSVEESSSLGDGSASGDGLLSSTASSDEISFSEDGKSLTYGLYPQTHVSEETEKPTVDSLNVLAAAEAEGNGWYLLDGEYYAKAAANPYGSGYKFDDGTAISSGTAYWFRCEPIKWHILKTEEGSYFLLSDRLLDAHRYNEYYKGKKNGYYANDYGNSEIRAWLNGAFYDSAFSLDSSLVIETEVDNSASTTYSSPNSYACKKTTDKVFLPSYQDLRNADYGFSTSDSDYDVARQCKTTDWARANYAYSSTSSSYYNNGWYWTRSPRPSCSCCASFVDDGGYLYFGNYVNNSGRAVRPCIALQRNA